MKLILSKEQKAKGMVSKKLVYSLTVKADLTDEERSNLSKYEMSDTVLYSDVEGDPAASAWKALKTIATATVIKVSDLSVGRTIECASFMEIMAVERQVVTACKNLKELLQAMAEFGGEQVIEI